MASTKMVSTMGCFSCMKTTHLRLPSSFFILPVAGSIPTERFVPVSPTTIIKHGLLDGMSELCLRLLSLLWPVISRESEGSMTLTWPEDLMRKKVSSGTWKATFSGSFLKPSLNKDPNSRRNSQIYWPFQDHKQEVLDRLPSKVIYSTFGI